MILLPIPNSNRPMTRHRTHSVTETEALGESLGRTVSAGTVIGLTGTLGAGKTAFVRGFARGLGCRGRAHSPTFSLFHEYAGGRCRLFHLDLYRLQGAGDVRTAGLEEYLVQPDGIALVEWIERWCGENPDAPVRRIRFEIVAEDIREILDDNPGA